MADAIPAATTPKAGKPPKAVTPGDEGNIVVTDHAAQIENIGSVGELVPGRTYQYTDVRGNIVTRQDN